MAAVARGIGETNGAVLKVKWLFWENTNFYNLFSQIATLPVCVFVSLFSNLLKFLSYYFSALKIFKSF